MATSKNIDDDDSILAFPHLSSDSVLMDAIPVLPPLMDAGVVEKRRSIKRINFLYRRQRCRCFWMKRCDI